VSTILAINSSAARDGSVSRMMVDHAVGLLMNADPDAVILRRDLGLHPIPHLSNSNLAGVRGAPSTASEYATRALSSELIAELRAADLIVIGAPMYNFSIPTALRGWFDYVLRAGETFRYSEAGPQGLLRGKRTIVMESRGGLYSEGLAKGMDFQEPYLRALLGFAGITDVTFVRAEQLGFGPEVREHAIRRARHELTALVEMEYRRAA